MGELAKPVPLCRTIAEAQPDAILAFPGLLTTGVPPAARVGRIVNATASTTFNDPNQKVATASPAGVLRMGGDAVAMHLNLGHPESPRMLRECASLTELFRLEGVPVLIASYVPDADPVAQWQKIAHAARIAADLGASLIKTAYTGSPTTYARIVEAAKPATVVTAGGPFRSISDSFETAKGALDAGAGGVCFGRTIFESREPRATLRGLSALIHDGLDPTEALEAFVPEAQSADHPLDGRDGLRRE